MKISTIFMNILIYFFVYKENNVLKRNRMKTKLFLVLLILALNAPVGLFASNTKKGSGNPGVPASTENKLSETEVARLTKRVEEIRSMDKSTLSATEKRELRKELKGIKEKVKRDGRYIYISVGTLLVIILILLLI